MTRVEQKNEALKRMKKLELSEDIIREFDKENKLNLSEYGGMLLWLDEQQQRIVKEYEQKSGSLVYHVIHGFAEFGELYNMLCVSKYRNEWQRDMLDIENGRAFAYVKNITDDFSSEYGLIHFEKNFGGLNRIL
ncbi:hypothetical protein [Clostridium oryzae]|uniref:Uncharacterized protein n=1 Tax=Clostridium oryzae TaxID=1450648 RepID=A0A1V4IDC3_9CLOT|nr:hypothetical protein [Clostridium oryzae]OPJ57943.1 hypothetical protein CLORY_38520 [Clostridium oryzae]